MRFLSDSAANPNAQNYKFAPLRGDKVWAIFCFLDCLRPEKRRFRPKMIILGPPDFQVGPPKSNGLPSDFPLLGQNRSFLTKNDYNFRHFSGPRRPTLATRENSKFSDPQAGRFEGHAAMACAHPGPRGGTRGLDMLVYGATPSGQALCCDATPVSPLTCTRQPQPCSADVDRAALGIAERGKRAPYPELAAGGPQRVPKSAAAGMAVLWTLHEPVPAGHHPQSGEQRCQDGRADGGACCHVQQAVAGTALGCAWPTASPTSMADAPPLERVLNGRGAESSRRLGTVDMQTEKSV